MVIYDGNLGFWVTLGLRVVEMLFTSDTTFGLGVLGCSRGLEFREPYTLNPKPLNPKPLNPKPLNPKP